MAHSSVIIDRRSVKKDGTYPIKIRVTNNGEFYIGLGVDVFENQWREIADTASLKSKTGIVINHPLAARYNNLISSRKIEVDRKIIDLTESRRILKMDIRELKDYLTSDDKVVKEYLFNEHYEKYVAGLTRKNTISSLKYTYAKMSKFCNIEDLSFHDINFSWLKDFDKYMSDSGLSVNTRGIYMRNLKAIFNDAINREHISLALYPFRKFRIAKEATMKRALTIEQLRLFMNFEFSQSQEKFKDFFMLLFYLRGINTIDLSKISEITNGRIFYRRCKTGKLYNIELLPQAMEIINKYRGVNCLLYFYENKTTYRNFSLKVNSQLKLMCAQLDGETTFPRISTYWARHTWATTAANIDIPKETIAAALGHGGNTVTDIYIDLDHRKVDEANRKVIDFLYQDGAEL